MDQGTEDGLEKKTLQALHKPGSPALVLHIVSVDGLQTLWTRPEPHPLSTFLAGQKIHLESHQSGLSGLLNVRNREPQQNGIKTTGWIELNHSKS
jgi:hypothetical protein